MVKARWRVLSALALLTVIGCGDDSTDPEGSISVSVSPSTLSVPQGGTGTISVTLTRGGGFDEPVTVTVEGLPAGVTGSVNPTQLTGTTTAAQVTVNVANTVAAGNYPATVRASAAGIGAATAQYTLTVTAAPTGSYTLSATAASIAQGSSGTSTISIQRTNFTGPVALTLENPPAGITGTFNPASAPGDNSVLTINVAGTVAPNTYNLTVKGTATGQADKTTTVALTVTAPANYTLSATPATLSVNAGSSGQTTVNIARTNFTGAVTLSLDAPPAGITATFVPAAPTTNSSTATINVGSAVTPGNHTVTIKGTAAGLPDKTTAVTVTVGASATFSLLASPTSVSIAQGGTGTSTIGIVRTNFTSDVALTLVNPSQGITGTFTPATLTGTTASSQLQLTVPASAAPGTYPITVQGVGGSITQTATVNVTVTAGAGFTITASPATLTIAPGANSSTTVTIARTNFTTDVALSLVNPPAGITGAFTPATLTGTTLTSSLQVNVAGTVAPGTHPVTVQGVGGSVTQTATVTVTVPAGGSSVTLAMQPTTLTIQQGGSSSATLTATRTNYTGNITPSVTGNPAGMTVTFNPNPITSGNTSQVTVNVGAGVAPNTYTLTITGAAGAAGNPTTTLGVTVTAPTGGSIVYEFCNNDDPPLKFWRQSGGTWAEVAPTAGTGVTRFSFDISGATGGIAYVRSITDASVQGNLRTSTRRTSFSYSSRQASQKAVRDARRLTNQTGGLTDPYFDTFVMFALTTEIQSFRSTCTTPTLPTPVNKSFTVTGMGAGEQGTLTYGNDGEALTPATSNYTLQVAPGTYDWLAAFGPAPAFPSFASVWTHYRMGRAEPAPGGTVAINRTGATAFVTVPFTVTGGTAGSFNAVVQTLTGPNGTLFGLSVGEPFSTSSSGSLVFLAPADRLATDMNSVALANFDITTDIVQRIQLQWLGPNPPASANFTLPATVPSFTVTPVAMAPVPTWTVAGSIPAGFQTADSEVEVSYTGAGESTLYTITATRGWLTANSMSTSYSLTGPTLPNFLAQWAPAAPLFDAQVAMYSNLRTVPVTGTVQAISLRLVETP